MNISVTGRDKCPSCGKDICIGINDTVTLFNVDPPVVSKGGIDGWMGSAHETEKIAR